MYRIDVPITIYQMDAIFHMLGFRRMDDSIHFGQWFRFIYFSTYISLVFVKACVTDDSDETVYLIVITIIGTVQIFRMYYVIWKKNVVCNLTREIGVNYTSDYETFCDADKKMKKCIVVAKIFCFIMVSSNVAVLVLPLISDDKRLAFSIAFPVPYQNGGIAFLIAYVFQGLGYCCSAIQLFFSLTLWHIMVSFVIRIEILGNNFKRLGMVQTEMNAFGTQHIKLKQRLYIEQFIVAIKDHKDIIKRLKHFSTTFSDLFLLQMVTRSIGICGAISTLAFSSHDDIVQDFFYCVVLFYCLFDCFIVMYLGNEIMLASDRLSYSLFESDWTAQTESCKRYFLISVERLKRPEIITVGKLFPLNLETFTVIVKRSYSLFNILENVR